jgi:L-lactate dehydrogenase (cytochrome)
MVSTNASLSPAQIAAARVSPEQTLFFQLYKKKEDAAALELIREVEALGYSAIFLTVDAVVPGNRERDIKAPWVLEDQERAAEGKPPSVNDPQDKAVESTLGTAGGLIAGNDADMTWEKVCTHIPCSVYTPNRIGPDDPLVEESDKVTDRDQG